MEAHVRQTGGFYAGCKFAVYRVLCHFYDKLIRIAFTYEPDQVGGAM